MIETKPEMKKNFHRIAEIQDGAIQLKVIYTTIVENKSVRIKNLSVVSIVDYGFPNLFYFDDRNREFYTMKARWVENNMVIEKNYLNKTPVSDLVKRRIIQEISGL